MIAFIEGTLVKKTISTAVVSTASGLGYELFVPVTDIQQLPPNGSKVLLHTYLQVKEDGVALFGFLSEEELQIFKLLITVSGIGPKGALAVLSVMDADGLRFAIISGDAKAIAKAPGVGAKTAERVIIDLKDKVSIEDTFMQKESPAYETSGQGAGDVLKEAAEALTALGYPASDALKAVKQVENAENMEVEELLKQALKKLF